MDDYSPEPKPLFEAEKMDCERVPVKGKSLEFQLEEKDIAALGKEAADLQVEIVRLEAEFENQKRDCKDRIAGKKNEFREKLRILHSGKSIRTVDCIMVKNFAKNLVQYEFEGKVVSERAMEAAERQAEMFSPKIEPASVQADQAAINAAFGGGNSQAKEAAEQRLKDAVAETDQSFEGLPQTAEPCDAERDRAAEEGE